MLEEQRKRVETAISDMINDMYKTHLRKMQSDMHLCAVKCCDNVKRQPTMDNVQNCIEDCAAPLVRAQDYMQHELGQFQVRLQRCVMQCNEDIRGKVPNNTREPDLRYYQQLFERCTVRCVDKHIDLIPSMMRSIKSVLASGPNAMRQA